MTDQKVLADAIDPRTSLISRLEAATGPDRELDCAITEMLDPSYTPEKRVTYYGEATGEHVGEDGQFYASPAYTGSLDAAMTLVPEGWDWSIGTSRTTDGRVAPCFHGYVRENQISVESMHADAEGSGRNERAPAIALCVAALKARGIGSGE